jgi:hypothetical protein
VTSDSITRVRTLFTQLPTFQTTPDASVRGAEPRGRVQCLGGRQVCGQAPRDPAPSQYIRGMVEQTGHDNGMQ